MLLLVSTHGIIMVMFSDESFVTALNAALAVFSELRQSFQKVMFSFFKYR
jgi:hypothetical protein